MNNYTNTKKPAHGCWFNVLKITEDGCLKHSFSCVKICATFYAPD